MLCSSGAQGNWRSQVTAHAQAVVTAQSHSRSNGIACADMHALEQCIVVLCLVCKTECSVAVRFNPMVLVRA